MLGVVSKEQEIRILRSLAYKVKNNDSYFKQFKGVDTFGMPLVMPQDEYIIRTLIDIYGVTCYQDVLDVLEKVELENDEIKGSLIIHLKISNKKKISYTKLELTDLIRFPDNQVYTAIKEEAIEAVKKEYKLKGTVTAEIVSEEEYNQNVKGTSYVKYELGQGTNRKKGKNI